MKGPSIALLLGDKKAKSKEGDDDVRIEEPDSGVAFDDAADECLRALRNRDNAGFADALKDCIEICLEAHESGSIGDESSIPDEGGDY